MGALLLPLIEWIADKTGIKAGLVKGGLIALALFAVVGSVATYHYSAIDAAADQARLEAINECNTTQLEEELRLANLKAEAAEDRADNLAADLAEREREARDREQFISDLEDELENYEDGVISERTRAFMSILSARSAQYHEPQE